ncbi:hypothetical protein [Burkholderia ambifaria]|uniref:hypothetical protein n=1 Tax=Burkholderia ambifaria TaxID=152480 RepID=UPI00158EA5EA|nr:hypothetical protein [Burkholderia ambifaria]
MIEIVRRANLATLLPPTTAPSMDLVAVALEPAVPRRTALLLPREEPYRSAPRRSGAQDD